MVLDAYGKLQPTEFKKMADDLPVGVILLNGDHAVEFANAAASTIWGLPREAMLQWRPGSQADHAQRVDEQLNALTDATCPICRCIAAGQPRAAMVGVRQGEAVCWRLVSARPRPGGIIITLREAAAHHVRKPDISYGPPRRVRAVSGERKRPSS